MGNKNGLGSKYLSVLDKYIFMGGGLQHMDMSPAQKLRTMIVYEAYQVWMSNKQIRPMELCRRISSRIYGEMEERARVDETFKRILETNVIDPSKPRGMNALAKDVEALDHIIGRFNNPTVNIEKAKVIDASDWLIEHGQKTGDGRDVAKGAELKMKLNRDFDEREQGFDDIAKTDINITGDVSVVKSDKVNYTDEEKEAFARKYHLKPSEVIDMVKNDEGVYESAPMEEEEEEDIFVSPN